MHDDASAAEVSERALEKILHRVAAGLALPAAKWTAVVSDQQFQTLDFFCPHEVRWKIPVRTPNLRKHAIRQRLFRRCAGIKIALQDELRRHLVDDGAAITHVATAFMQGALRCHGSETFVPKQHFAWYRRAQTICKDSRFLRCR